MITNSLLRITIKNTDLYKNTATKNTDFYKNTATKNTDLYENTEYREHNYIVQ